VEKFLKGTTVNPDSVSLTGTRELEWQVIPENLLSKFLPFDALTRSGFDIMCSFHCAKQILEIFGKNQAS
jgi:hypothetical protein